MLSKFGLLVPWYKFVWYYFYILYQFIVRCLSIDDLSYFCPECRRFLGDFEKWGCLCTSNNTMLILFSQIPKNVKRMTIVHIMCLAGTKPAFYINMGKTRLTRLFFYVTYFNV